MARKLGKGETKVRGFNGTVILKDGTEVTAYVGSITRHDHGCCSELYCPDGHRFYEIGSCKANGRRYTVCREVKEALVDRLRSYGRGEGWEAILESHANYQAVAFKAHDEGSENGPQRKRLSKAITDMITTAALAALHKSSYDKFGRYDKWTNKCSPATVERTAAYVTEYLFEYGGVSSFNELAGRDYFADAPEELEDAFEAFEYTDWKGPRRIWINRVRTILDKLAKAGKVYRTHTGPSGKQIGYVHMEHEVAVHGSIR